MYTFSPNTVIESAKVNANFAEITDGLETGVMVGDGSGEWFAATGTWAYVSASSLTVPSADAAKMNAGTRLKLTQTTVKYFNVASISGTTVTIDISTDYTLTNAAISLGYSSNAVSPPGFPSWFSFTPSWTSSGTQPALVNGTISGRYARIGKTIVMNTQLILGSSSTAGTGTYRLSFPATPATPNVNQDLQPIGTAMVTDSGFFNSFAYPVFRTGVTAYYEIGMMDKSGGGAPWVTFNGWSQTSFTHNTSDLIRTHIIYEAA